MKIIDDNSKKLHWWNRNYFFVCTIAVVLVNILLYGLCGSTWVRKLGAGATESVWLKLLDFRNIVRAFCNSFAHIDWQHVLLNMLCFFIAGIYLERKDGTIPFFFLVFTLVFFSALAATANKGSNLMVGDIALDWVGFSCTNFALYAYIIVDYAFLFLQKTRTKFHVIAGAVILVLIYLSMCSDGNWFTWYPRNLIENAGHYTGFLTGLILGLLIHLTRLKTEWEMRQ